MILEKISTCIVQEPDERMMGSFDLSGSTAKFADACNRFSSNLDVSGL